MFFIAEVFLAIHQLPNPPAWQLTREGEESWPESMKKAEIMDFRGGSPSLELQFHLSCQDPESSKCHASKGNLQGETRIYFFLLGMEDFLKFNNLQHFNFAPNLISWCFISLLEGDHICFLQISPLTLITAFHTWNNHYATWSLIPYADAEKQDKPILQVIKGNTGYTKRIFHWYVIF